MNKGSFVSAYYDVSMTIPAPLQRRGAPAEDSLLLEFKLNNDVSELAPYINSVAKKAVYYEKPRFIKFLLDDYGCALHRNIGSAAAFSGRDQGLEFLERLLRFLNEIHVQRDFIEPNYKTYHPISALGVYKLLPRTNCGECGYPSCLAFAAALSRRKDSPERCSGFRRPIAINAVYPVFDSKGNLVSTVSIDINEPAMKMPARPPHLIEDQEHLLPRNQPNGVVTARGNDSLPAPLTSRELVVLRMISEGATNVEISNLLKISPHTVKSHVIHIFNKLGVNDRTQAAVLATRHNLV